jgi:hypothetical protein
MGLRAAAAVAAAVLAAAGSAQAAPACHPFEQLAGSGASRAEAKAWSFRLRDPSLRLGRSDPLVSGGPAQASLRIRTAGGLVEGPPKAREVSAARRGGTWRVAYRMIVMPDRGPVVTGRWHVRRLPEADARALDAAMTDPCLWRAPHLLLPAARLTSGLYTHCVDAPSTVYALRSGSRRWEGRHLCWTVGAPGRVRQVLMHAAFGQDFPSMDDDFGGLLGPTPDEIDPSRR